MARYDDLLDDVNVILPGIARPIVRPVIKRVVKEFCENSRIWRVTLPAFDIPRTEPGQLVNVAQYCANDLIRHEAKLLDVMAVSIGGTPLPTSHYDRQARTGFVLNQSYRAGTCEVTASLTPDADEPEIPDFLISDWAVDIAYGIAARLSMQPGQTWTNPALAQDYRRLFKEGSNRAKAEANNQRQGNRVVPHNFYGG